MQYRQVGKTGMNASIIGLGAERLDNKPDAVVNETIGAALDHGINIIDLFMPGERVRTQIGKALKGKRDKVLIQGHIGSCDLNQQYDITRDLATCKKYFEALLTCLETDYIDFGMLFFMDSMDAFDKVFNSNIIKYVQKLKQDGTLRAIGASSHNPIVAQELVKTGLVESILFSINPAFDMTPASQDVLAGFDNLKENEFSSIQTERLDFYRQCEKAGVGITVMKTLGAGKLLSADQTPFKKPMTVGQCIHYALTRPAVASVMIGCQNAKQIQEATHYLDLTDEQRDYTDVISGYQADFSGKCVYCSHCQPCPVDIDIASVHKYLDIALLDEGKALSGVKAHYGELKAHGRDCIACGSCESRCPFNVPIIENMQKAANIFGE